MLRQVIIRLAYINRKCQIPYIYLLGILTLSITLARSGTTGSPGSLGRRYLAPSVGAFRPTGPHPLVARRRRVRTASRLSLGVPSFPLRRS